MPVSGKPTITVSVGMCFDVDPRTRAALAALGWTPPPAVRPGHEDCEVDDQGHPYRVCTDASPDAPLVVQWWSNGDHPGDGVGEPRTDLMTGETFEAVEGGVVRYFRHPSTPGDSLCGTCGRRFHDHGWIDQGPDGITVCPGDLVITWRGRYTTAPEPTPGEDA
jgi:hypothetical protein